MSATSSRIWRYCILGIGGLLALVLLIITVVSLALYTEAGSRRVALALLERANGMDGFNLQTDAITGNLLSGLTLTNVVLEIPAVQIRAGSVRSVWNPYSILSGSFYLSELEITELLVSLTDDDADPIDPVDLLQIEALPIDVAIGALSFNDITVIASGQSYQVASLSLAAQLNGRNLRVQNLHLAAAPLTLDLSLQAELHDDIALLASLNWEYQGALFANYELAAGSAAITGDLRNLHIQHELLAPEAIHSSGTISAPFSSIERSVALAHSTELMRSPFEGLTDYVFDNVSLLTNWHGSDIDLELRSGVTSELLPPLQLSANGTLTGSTLLLAEANIGTASGSLSGSGQLDWSGPLQSAFIFSLEERSPLQYLTMTLPLELSDVAASGIVNFNMIDAERQLSLVVDEFSGTTGAYELTGAMAVNVAGDRIQVERLHLNTIANEIVISGEYEDQLHLDWQLTAPALEQMLPGITGAASGSGQIDGALDNPSILAALQVQGLNSGVFSASNMELSLNGTRAQLHGSMHVTEIAVTNGSTEQSIDEIQIQFDGNLANHSLSATLGSNLADVSLVLEGGVTDISTQRWEGFLVGAQLRSDFGNWVKQDGVTALVLSPADLQIPDTCWELDAIDLCIEIASATDNQLQINASLANFSLAEFNNLTAVESPQFSFPDFPRLPAGIELTGTLSARLDGLLDFGGAPPQLNFTLVADESVLSIASNESIDEAIGDELIEVVAQRYSWDRLSISGQLIDGNWNLSGNAALSQQNVVDTNLGLNGFVDSTLVIDEIGNLDGVATATFAELGWIQAFLPELSNVQGSLEGEVGISGTLNAPLFAGELNLNNGTAQLNRFGLTLTDIASTVTGQSSGQVELSGSLTSDTGSIAFSGSIKDLYNDGRSLRATLQGNDFLLANIADVKLAVSPDLQLNADRALIQLRGDLHVPLLNLTLRELPETAVDVSRDVVVVNYPADRPELGRSIAASQSTLFDIPVSAEINLTLGDAVNVSGFGMQARLDGALAIQQRADGRNLTYGELGIVEGNYSIYGQTLDLRQGKLLFFGALDNPALDIRAIREVEGVTVGVLMNGTLKNIRSQLFSTPVLPDNDIIAVLVTGRPTSELGEQDGTAVLGAIASLGLDRSEGLTNQLRDRLGLDTFGINSTGNINSSALTIGKYLTPDIFIRYGVGLFDKQSKVAIDYSLTNHIMLQAESGEYQSIDLTYTVER